MMNLSLIPRHMHESVKSYVEHGQPTGSFLRAVLENDFKGAFMYADDINLHCIRNWAMFVYNELPMACQGSPEAVASWISRGGQYGIEENLDRVEASARDQTWERKA